jgi:quercetin dioxygenase-like cupin family protein
MPSPDLHHPDLLTEMEIPPDSTISRTLHQDDHCKVVLFGFAAGQELSEHTAAVPAHLHFLSGEAEVKLGDDTVTATAHSWVQMPARLPHAIKAKTPVKMLLTLLKGTKTGA